MFKKATIATAAALASFTAMPAAAEAATPQGYYQNGYYGDGYYDRDDRRAERRYYRQQQRADRRYYRQQQRAYARGGYDDRYYGYGRRCSGTTGTIVGAVAGGLLGREIERSGNYHRRGGTTGAIIGGALGALGGRAIDKSSCR